MTQVNLDYFSSGGTKLPVGLLWFASCTQFQNWIFWDAKKAYLTGMVILLNTGLVIDSVQDITDRLVEM